MTSTSEWKKYEHNPILPTVLATWMESQTANPDLLEMDNHYFMYFSGKQGRHSRIGLATMNKSDFNGRTWNVQQQPVIDIGRTGEYDGKSVIEPATVRVNGIVYLFYTAINNNNAKSICLATSEDGLHFRKSEKNPILFGCSPEIVYHRKKFYLFYCQSRLKGGFEIFLATSKNGVEFSEYQSKPILSVGRKDRWDSHSIVTPRIFKERTTFYMLYCGSDMLDDYPFDVGLATSTNLIDWKRYRQNPIFSSGESGAWDEGAIKFTTAAKIKNIYYLWYNGYGAITLHTQADSSDLRIGKSQIGMATLEKDYFFQKT